MLESEFLLHHERARGDIDPVHVGDEVHQADDQQDRDSAVETFGWSPALSSGLLRAQPRFSIALTIIVLQHIELFVWPRDARRCRLQACAAMYRSIVGYSYKPSVAARAVDAAPRVTRLVAFPSMPVITQAVQPGLSAWRAGNAAICAGLP